LQRSNCLLLYSDRECGVLLGERRLKRRHLPPSGFYRCGVFLGERWMLRLPLRQRTVQRRVSLSYSSSSSSSIAVAESLLLPPPPSSPIRRSSPDSPTTSSSSLLPPPPSFTRSSKPPAPLPRSLPLLHFITVPAPRFPTPISTVPSPPRPTFSYSDPNGPLSVFLLRTRQPPLHYLAPAPTAPDKPPSPSSTPLFALSIHLPVPFPSP
ncbi:unnamed protein product, partial [Musa hybrid cultivar]